MNLTIRFEGNAAKVLRDAAKRMSDMRPMMGEIATEMHDQTLARFAAEKGPTGVPWKKSQRAIEDGGKTLQHKGYLIDAVSPDFNQNEAIVGVEATASAAIYARIHQFGGTIRPKAAKVLSTPFGPRKSVTMPARPYLGFGEDDKEAIEQILSRHLNRAFEGGAT